MAILYRWYIGWAIYHLPVNLYPLVYLIYCIWWPFSGGIPVFLIFRSLPHRSWRRHFHGLLWGWDAGFTHWKKVPVPVDLLVFVGIETIKHRGSNYPLVEHLHMWKYVGIVETSPRPVVICGFFGSTYPLVNIQKTMENHDFSCVNQQTKWAMFNSYVKLPEGNQHMGVIFFDG